MHEKQSRLFIQHVAVYCRDRDSIPAQGLDNRIHFFREQNEIAGNGGPAAVRGLEIDRGGNTHGGGNNGCVIGNHLSARLAKLQNASIYLTAQPEKILNFLLINSRQRLALGYGSCIRPWG